MVSLPAGCKIGSQPSNSQKKGSLDEAASNDRMSTTWIESMLSTYIHMKRGRVDLLAAFD